MHFINGVFAV